VFKTYLIQKQVWGATPYTRRVSFRAEGVESVWKSLRYAALRSAAQGERKRGSASLSKPFRHELRLTRLQRNVKGQTHPS
ncbi:MAG: hypothetical protein WCO51_01525, partial [bacterium]